MVTPTARTLRRSHEVNSQLGCVVSLVLYGSDQLMSLRIEMKVNYVDPSGAIVIQPLIDAYTAANRARFHALVCDDAATSVWTVTGLVLPELQNIINLYLYYPVPNVAHGTVVHAHTTAAGGGA